MTTVTLNPRKTGDPQVDLTIYRVAHRAMQKGAHDLAGLGERLAGSADGLSRSRAADLRTYILLLCEDIHLHHSGEDRIGWPIISGSAGAHVDLTPFSADHDELDPVLDRLRETADRLAATPRNAAATAALAQDAVILRDMLDEHIGEEERDVFPIILEYVSVPDFKKWEKAMMDRYPKRNLWFLIPWSVSAIAPDEAAHILPMTPPPFRIANRLFAGKYRRFHHRIFG